MHDGESIRVTHLKITIEPNDSAGVNLFLFFNRHNINRLKMRIFYLLKVC